MEKTMNKKMMQLKKDNQIRKSLNDHLLNYGYTQFEPSYFEAYDDYRQCQGRSLKQETVKVVNPNGDVEILRPDVTFNILKEFSTYILHEPIKVSYDTFTFKSLKETGIQQKRQIGAEYFGNISIDADVEIIQLADHFLKASKSVFVLGHMKYIRGLLKEVACDEMVANEILIALYNKQQSVLERILKPIDISDDMKKKLRMLIDIKTYSLKEYKEGFINGEMLLAIQEIEYIISKLEFEVDIDLGLISLFDYYDGIVFKGFGKGSNYPILKGGRYDQLSGLFGSSMPAVGFAIEFDAYVRSVETC